MFDDAGALGLRRVKLTGGEPLLHPEFCKILYSLKKKRLSLSLETNGTLIDEEKAKAIKQTGCFVAISLDGPNGKIHDDLRDVKGAFQKTLRGASFLSREMHGFQVILSLYRKNYQLLPEMIDFVYRIGGTSLKLNVISEFARSSQMAAQGELLSIKETIETYNALNARMDEFPIKIVFDIPPVFKPLKSIKKDQCPTCHIKQVLGLLHDGRAGLCGIGVHVPELNFGNVLNGELRRVWSENKVLRYIRSGLPTKLKGVCGRCIFRNYCLGRCIAHTYFEKGSLLESASFCETAFSQGVFPESRLVNFNDTEGV